MALSSFATASPLGLVHGRDLRLHVLVESQDGRQTLLGGTRRAFVHRLSLRGRGHRIWRLVRRADSRAERLLNIQERLLHVPDGSLGVGLALPRLDQRHTRFVHPGVLTRTGDWSASQQRRRWQRWRWRRRRHRRQRRLAHDQALELLAAPRGHVEVVARPIHGARRLPHDLVAVEATRTTDPKHILTDTSKARVPRGVSIPVLQTFVLQDELLYHSWI
jgi:hypothetical protein